MYFLIKLTYTMIVNIVFFFNMRIFNLKSSNREDYHLELYKT